MYLEFFKLKQLPFRLTADPRFHFVGAEQARAKADLQSAVERGGGLILVSGDAGVGKTILLQDFLDHPPQNVVTVQIRQPEMSVDEFYQAMLVQLDGDTAPPAGAAAAASFDSSLTQQAEQGRTIVVAVDNGELLPEALLDEILRLPRRNRAAERHLRLVVAARPSLARALQTPRFAGAENRLGLHIKLLPLAPKESRAYIEHRLRVAGRDAVTLFHEDALGEIQRYSGGVPRLINTLADAALIAAFNRSHDLVNAVDVRSAVNQLQWVEFNARTPPEEPQAGAADDIVTGHIRIEVENAPVADFDLPLGKISVGRAPNNDVRIDSRFISRHHCQILTTLHYSVIEDLQSQNGLTVGSRRISVHRLQHGDKIRIGAHTLIYTRSPLVGPRKPSTLPLIVSNDSGDSDTSQTSLNKTQPPAPAVDLKPKKDG